MPDSQPVSPDHAVFLSYASQDVVDANRKVGAVVKVEATQEILVGLPIARVLRDDYAPG